MSITERGNRQYLSLEGRNSFFLETNQVGLTTARNLQTVSPSTKATNATLAK